MDSGPLLHGVEVDGAVSSSLPDTWGEIGRICSVSEISFGAGVKKADQGRKELDRL